MEHTAAELSTIRATVSRPMDLTSEQVYADVQARIHDESEAEITPESAVMIASWWQSSGNVGHVLASFASGAEVDRAELLADIYATRCQNEMDERDVDALDCLASFILR